MLWIVLVAGLLRSGLCLAQQQPEQTLSLLDAIGQTLANNANVRLQQQQVDIARAALEQASSQFDATVSASAGATRDNIPINSQQQVQYGVDVLRTDSMSYSLKMSQQSRNGWIWGAGLTSTRTTDTIGQLTELPAQNLGRLDFTVLIPLGKGGGVSANAGEVVADLEAKATGYDLQHSIAQNVFSTASAYWALVAALKNLTIAMDSEAVLTQLRSEVEKLIAADELPAAELTLIAANLTDKVSQRIAAERAVLDAKQSLGRSMGLAYAGIAQVKPSDDFPVMPLANGWDALQIARLAEMAMRNRADLAAVQIRRDAAKVGMDATAKNLQAKIDLRVNLGYASLSEGNGPNNTLWPYSRNPTGPNGGVSLTYEWPLSNRSSRAAMAQQTSAWEQWQVRVGDLNNAIGVGVEAAAYGVRQSSRQLAASVTALDLYRRTVDNEKTKHRLGQSALVDVLSVNDMLLAARASLVSYQVSYLSFLARLRFETGTLIDFNGNQKYISLERLTSTPLLTQP